MKTLKKLAKVLMLTLAVGMLFAAASSTDVSAKTVTAKTNYKKATAVKTGTTTVSAKKQSYVKFQATKDGTYKITFSNLKAKDTVLGNFYVSKLKGSSSYSYISSVKVKTEGGKSDILWMKSVDYGTVYGDTNKKKVNRYLDTRTATLKLSKGDVIYFDTWITSSSKYTYKVNVKKVK